MDKTSRNSLSLSEEQAMLLETSREFSKEMDYRGRQETA